MGRESLSEMVVVAVGARNADRSHERPVNHAKVTIGNARNDAHTPLTWETLAQTAKYRASELAKIAGVSLRTLQRFFRARHNCTVTDWLRELRLEAARTRLATCDSVKEVAFDLGYKQPSHFTRDFKDRFGVPPRSHLRGRVDVRFSR